MAIKQEKLVSVKQAKLPTPPRVVAELPLGLVRQLDFLCGLRGEPRSSIAREALRRYLPDAINEAVDIERAFRRQMGERKDIRRPEEE